MREQQISPSSVVDKSQIWKQLQHFSQFPDFNNYLVFILVRAETRSSVSQILCPSVVVHIEGVSGWPELLPALVTCLDSNDLNHMDGAMDALSKICEDIPHVLDSEVPGLAERPINILLPRLYQFFQSPHASLRKLALGSVNQYIIIMPAALYHSMDKYLQGLFVLANDPVAEVRKLVCASFVHLTEVLPSSIEPHLRNVMEYMLQVNKDPDEEVALEACEFWSAYCDAQLPPENLKEFLPRLIPVLLSNMAYADDDESLLDAEEDESQPDRDQDLKPRFHTSRLHGSEDFDGDDDDSLNVWNLRKCSAAAIDVLSNVFGDEILSALMPLIQAKLSASGDEAWKDREAAVLALGTIAEGCIDGLYPHLSEIVAFLLPRLDDKFPLIRSISCWTLSRFSKYLVQESANPKGYEQFEKVLMGLLRRLLDTNKRVQEAACSAFATVEKDAAEELVPHLGVILQHLMGAFGKYQRRNLRILYDAIGTLAFSVREELDKPAHLEILMPPLVAKLQQLSNSDEDLFPLLECFTSISQVLGDGLAQPVFHRCRAIITEHRLANVANEFSQDALCARIFQVAQGIVKSQNNPPVMGKRKRIAGFTGGRNKKAKTEHEEEDLVAIRRHVELLNSSCSGHKVVAAISLVAKFDGNIETFCGKLSIPALVQYLESPWSSLEKDCALPLGLIAACERTYQCLSVVADPILPRVNLLGRQQISCGCIYANGVITRAADLISRIARDNPRMIRNIRDEGGIPPLVKLLYFPDDSVQIAAAKALQTLSSGERPNNNQIVMHYALPALVSLLQSTDNLVQRAALGAIGNLVLRPPANRKEVIEAGALLPVINLLSSPYPETQKEAALLIGQFAVPHSVNKVQLGQRGAITPLIKLLQSSDEQVMEASAFALGRLARDTQNQASIGHGGGISSLLDLLDVLNEDVQDKAAFALWRLARNEENVLQFIKASVWKLQDRIFTHEETHRRVVETLHMLEVAIRSTLVLSPLLYLMRTGQMQIEIALSLAYLCHTSDCKDIFIYNKGLEILMNLLDSSIIMDQRNSSKALWRLAKRVLAKREPPLDSEEDSEKDSDEGPPDVTFLICDKTVFAHRSRVEASSQVFRAMLSGRFVEKNTVEIQGIRYEVFEVMMRYIDTGLIDIPKEMAQDLFAAAEQYSIKPLQRLCEKTLIEEISIENIQAMYELATTLAQSYNASAVREACTLWILEHYTQMIWFPDFIKDIKFDISRFFTALFTAEESVSYVPLFW